MGCLHSSSSLHNSPKAIFYWLIKASVLEYRSEMFSSGDPLWAPPPPQDDLITPRREPRFSKICFLPHPQPLALSIPQVNGMSAPSSPSGTSALRSVLELCSLRARSHELAPHTRAVETSPRTSPVLANFNSSFKIWLRWHLL